MLDSDYKSGETILHHVINMNVHKQMQLLNGEFRFGGFDKRPNKSHLVETQPVSVSKDARQRANNTTSQTRAKKHADLTEDGTSEEGWRSSQVTAIPRVR